MIVVDSLPFWGIRFLEPYHSKWDNFGDSVHHARIKVMETSVSLMMTFIEG